MPFENPDQFATDQLAHKLDPYQMGRASYAKSNLIKTKAEIL